MVGEFITHYGEYRIFCFQGELGSGKTTLISGCCSYLGSTDTMSSPTFSIVNEYKLPNGKIYHFDLYRMKSLEEIMDIGFEEYIHSGHYCFIEWPEKVKKILPQNETVYCELNYISLNERSLKAWA